MGGVPSPSACGGFSGALPPSGHVTAASKPPRSYFQAVQGPTHTWTLAGRVQDETPPACRPVRPSPRSAVDGTGRRRRLVHLTATIPGEAGWAPSPSVGTRFRPCSVMVNAAPQLTLWSRTAPDGRSSLPGGHGRKSGGLTVNFSAWLRGAWVANADGTFRVELVASALGTIQATTQE